MATEKELYDRWKEFEVTAASLLHFLSGYYKSDRYRDRGKEYRNFVDQSQRDDLEKFGYCIISRHDSVTGEAVAYFGK